VKFTNNLIALAILAISSKTSLAAPLPGVSSSTASAQLSQLMNEQQQMLMQAQQANMQMQQQSAQSLAGLHRVAKSKNKSIS
jgi:hypothetical protein